MTLVPAAAGATAAVVHGLGAAETGINANKFDIDYQPEFKDFMLDYIGEKRGFAIGATESAITVEGDVLLTASGLMTSVFGTAATLTNTTNGFGQTAGGIYLDRAKVTLGNTTWKGASFNFSRNAGIA